MKPESKYIVTVLNTDGSEFTFSEEDKEAAIFRLGMFIGKGAMFVNFTYSVSTNMTENITTALALPVPTLPR